MKLRRAEKQYSNIVFIGLEVANHVDLTSKESNGPLFHKDDNMYYFSNVPNISLL